MNILPEEGKALIRAQEQRAINVFEQTPAALLLSKYQIKQDQAISYDYDFGEAEELPGHIVVWSWADGEINEAEQCGDDLIILQVDEVKVIAQPQTGKAELLIGRG